MFNIVDKRQLNKKTALLEIYAPWISKKATAGQFVILRADKEGERLPFTITDFDRQKQTVTIIYKTVGAGTMRLDRLVKGDKLMDVVGPLGRSIPIDGLKKVAVIGGDNGCASAYIFAKELHNAGCVVDTAIGFKTAEDVILAEQFKAVSDNFVLLTDDGSAGQKGVVTDALQKFIDDGNVYDQVIDFGHIIMMKNVCDLTKKYGIKTIVSMAPIMLDGTGMCGGCRLTVNGQVKFACIDGPDFDGFTVDFEEAIQRNKIYAEQERKAYQKACNLFKKEAQNG